MKGLANRFTLAAFYEGDIWSPVLVKEVRQRLRSNVFVALFLCVHVAMGLVALLELSSASQGLSHRSAASSFYWTVIGGVMVMLIPSFGFSAIRKEQKENTLELIMLTSDLSAYKIVYGKWLALLAQALVIISSLLPYVLLRYLTLGISFFNEAFTYANIFLISCFFCSASIYISCLSKIHERLFFVVSLFFGLSLFNGFYFAILGRLFGGHALWNMALYLFEVALFVLLLKASVNKILGVNERLHRIRIDYPKASTVS